MKKQMTKIANIRRRVAKLVKFADGDKGYDGPGWFGDNWPYLASLAPAAFGIWRGYPLPGYWLDAARATSDLKSDGVFFNDYTKHWFGPDEIQVGDAGNYHGQLGRAPGFVDEAADAIRVANTRQSPTGNSRTPFNSKPGRYVDMSSDTFVTPSRARAAISMFGDPSEAGYVAPTDSELVGRYGFTPGIAREQFDRLGIESGLTAPPAVPAYVVRADGTVPTEDEFRQAFETASINPKGLTADQASILRSYYGYERGANQVATDTALFGDSRSPGIFGTRVPTIEYIPPSKRSPARHEVRSVPTGVAAEAGRRQLNSQLAEIRSNHGIVSPGARKWTALLSLLASLGINAWNALRRKPDRHKYTIEDLGEIDLDNGDIQTLPNGVPVIGN